MDLSSQHDVLCEPMITNCGHRLCRACVNEIMQTNRFAIFTVDENDKDGQSKPQVTCSKFCMLILGTLYIRMLCYWG